MVKYNIYECLKKGIDALKENEYANSFLEAELLLAHLLNKDRVYILTHRDKEVSSEIFHEYISLINKRKNGYPLQYITGSQEFMGILFQVIDGVLIPRPDTENIVEKIISLYEKDSQVEILDIGAGSGAIGLSIAYFLPKSTVTLVDIDDTALENILINKRKLNITNAAVKKVDVFSNDIFNLSREYDLIVSNPPYIPSNDIVNLQKEVSLYEPRIALDGGNDGLDYYRRITKIFNYLSKDKGILALEIGYNQYDEVKSIIEENNKPVGIETIKDLQGFNRGLIVYS